ncbi:SufD family Fe-S cluster assembly protein [Peloplasma aerotolerans]|uniref:SufD family Fe-S cluster assembly protein n=1 Tax=Peloplasma aerotolerans TaxID=3044389 RepID=A0AAW6UBA7_9MOLU|nr:SufD family Fe-S cluster assembly protein [Mariniplasma sp. M4Ah]MDI6452949.1 SufD family Fe-S cluster assembly protein [Mariniplasma sp. M4Ah]
MNSIVIKNHEVVSGLPKDFIYENQQLTIPKNIQYQDPFKITLEDDSNESFEIIVSENTGIKIILEVVSEDTTDNNYKIKLHAKSNTQVKYLLISELSSLNANLEHHFVVDRDAKLDLIGGFVSNILTAKMHVDLVGEGAEVKLRAIAVSSDDHQQSIDVLIVHKAPNTFGDMTNIGIANKRGKIVLNGVEKIEKGMKHANAFQTLKGIITSDEARVEVNPILLIDEYDVKAGHGATIGKIAEDALFYLRSRGLTHQEAEKLIINGFLRPVIDEIDDEPLKERFVHVVNSRI